MVLFSLINGMDWDLNRIRNLFYINSNLGRHTGTDFLGWLDDLHNYSVLFDVRSEKVSRFGILIYFNDPSEKFIIHCADGDFHRHPISYQGDA